MDSTPTWSPCPWRPTATRTNDHELGHQVTASYAHGRDPRRQRRGRAGPRTRPVVVDQDQPGDDERGFVVFFTGLSGSGKSTIARALHDLIIEDGRRTVTILDGDVVRRNRPPA